MKRTSPWAMVLVPFLMAACGPGTVQITAEIDVVDPDTGERVNRSVENLVVHLIPFDRDVLLDSLASAAPRPEPGFPLELQIMQDSLFAALEAQRDAETQWLAQRQRLQEINEEMSRYSPAEGQYHILFNEYGDVEAAVTSAERRQNEAFSQVEAIQARVLGDIAVARNLQEEWEDEAFADYFTLQAARLQEARREIVTDTTNALGLAQLRGNPGTWWVHSRYRLPTEELYWNIRVDVERGDPLEIRLSRENAERRRVF